MFFYLRLYYEEGHTIANARACSHEETKLINSFAGEINMNVY